MFVTKYTKQFLIVTVAIFVIGIGLIVSLGLPLGIDFTGGALTEASYDVRPDKGAIETSLNELSLGGYSLRASVDETGKDGFLLRSRDLTEGERLNVEGILTSVGEGGAITRYTSIGPVIGEELKNKAGWAVGAVALMIVFYVAFAFRSVPKPVSGWGYGFITILALIHDVLVPSAVMSVLGYYMGAEVDVLFIMAVLAVLGYSVNDTIVVFDRIRENLLIERDTNRHEHFSVLVGKSVSQSMARSINTSLTTFTALLALYLLGGDVTRNFALVLMAGVVAGAYSSICIASPLLIKVGEWQKSKGKK
jgi:preprotein translocase subunit SecF